MILNHAKYHQWIVVTWNIGLNKFYSWTKFQELLECSSFQTICRWREEGLQGPCPSPPEVEPAPSVPLIDPYAPSTAYPEAPPEAPPPVASPSPPPAPAPVPVPKPHQEARQVRQVPQTPVAPKAAPKQAPQVPKVAPETESWSSKQQRLKKEQREARLAENLRRFCSSCCLSWLKQPSCFWYYAPWVQN